VRNLAATVSEAAWRCGFRDLSRFAGAYRDVFGELQSATLRRGLRSGMAHLVLHGPRGGSTNAP